jgi:hypothetical protein
MHGDDQSRDVGALKVARGGDRIQRAMICHEALSISKLVDTTFPHLSLTGPWKNNLDECR